MLAPAFQDVGEIKEAQDFKDSAFAPATFKAISPSIR
jgi:hypothetical protein